MAKVMLSYLSFLVAASCILQLSLCQECSELDVGNDGEPQSGADLSICTTTDQQCCLQNYIDSVMMIASNELNQELRSRLRDTTSAFNRTVNSVQNYFIVDFGRVFTRLLPDLAGRLDVNSLIGIIAPSLNTVVDNLLIDDSTRGLNLTQVINSIVTALGNAAGNLLARNNATTQACILNAIWNNLNQSDVDLVIRAIQELRRAFTVLRRSANFFQQYVENLQFRFPRNCVRRFVELNFCARCTQKTPPLCSNTCGALVRGCLSAYYSALSRQFDILWNVSRQVVMITNSTLQALFFEERQLIDQTMALNQAFACVGGRLPIGKRQSGVPSREDLLPLDSIRELRNLTGRAFTYARDIAMNYQGPAICWPSAEEFMFCRSSDGTRMRSQNCSSGDPCSSSCRCFDGKNERMDNTEEFSVDGIEGQEDNPAIDLDTDELVEIAVSVGTPVSAFLMQDEITNVIPESVSIPPGEPYNPDGGATTLAVSVTMLLMGIVAALFF